IGCPTGARSVLVFSDRPLAALVGARVGITGETSTSVELLRVLLALRHGVEPAAWVGPDEPCDAVLLIGDQAIQRLTRGPAAPHGFDLGIEWRGGAAPPPPFPPAGGGAPPAPPPRPPPSAPPPPAPTRRAWPPPP